MAATGKPNHWDELAEELGAETPPPRSAPKSDPPRPPATPRKTPPPQPIAKPPSTNWGDLASSLGVAGGSESPRHPPAAREEIQVGDEDDSPSVGHSLQRDEDQDDDDEDLFGYDFEPDMAFECDLFVGGLSAEPSSEPAPPAEAAADVVSPTHDESSDADTDVEDESAAEADASEDDAARSEDPPVAEDETIVRKPRRRRRGRRGKRSGPESKDSATESTPGDEQDAGASDTDLETIEDAIIESPGEEDELNRDSESSSKRPKRRRRRRGGRKAAAKKSADDGDDDDDVGDTFEDPANDSLPIAKSGDEEDEEDPKGGGDRGKHRAIPSWGDAIGVIIETNMASRAKKPSSSSSSSRGRGRRGRGRPSGGK